MAKVVTRQVVSGSQELVWHVLSDFDRMPEWLPGVTSIEHTGGPPKAFGREHVAQNGRRGSKRISASWPGTTRGVSPGGTSGKFRTAVTSPPFRTFGSTHRPPPQRRQHRDYADRNLVRRRARWA